MHVEENEGVVASALRALDIPSSSSLYGRFALARALPSWLRRGVSHQGLSQQQSDCLVRCDPGTDRTNGFFVALFVRDFDLASVGCKKRKRSISGSNITGTSSNSGAGIGSCERRSSAPVDCRESLDDEEKNCVQGSPSPDRHDHGDLGYLEAGRSSYTAPISCKTEAQRAAKRRKRISQKNRPKNKPKSVSTIVLAPTVEVQCGLLRVGPQTV